MAYSRDCTICTVEQYLKPDKIAELYKQEFINWRGAPTDTEEAYSEAISACLLLPENLARFEAIKPIRRESSYRVDHNDQGRTGASTRQEELSAIEMVKCERLYEHLGEMLDYQVPLKNKRTDKAGKIDLLAYHRGDNTLRIIEYKTKETPETLLRCVLEIYTYYRTVCREKLCKDFGVDKAQVRPAILVYKDSTPHGDYLDEKKPNLRALMGEWGIELFVITGGNCPADYVIEAVQQES
ncbi:MAG: hypothetical protein LBN04_04530 [Oscillospiraceae bacterium]|nr:hypothetical protein [Oscillospiraceae bacterium]